MPSAVLVATVPSGVEPLGKRTLISRSPLLPAGSGVISTNCTRVRPLPMKFGVTLIAATSPVGLAGTVESELHLGRQQVDHLGVQAGAGGAAAVVGQAVAEGLAGLLGVAGIDLDGGFEQRLGRRRGGEGGQGQRAHEDQDERTGELSGHGGSSR